MQGTWLQLRNLNLPAVLEFAQPLDVMSYAVLTGFKGDQVELATSDGKAFFDLGDVLAIWTGHAVVVWKWSGDTFKSVFPGDNAPLVGWIRNQLGAPPAAAGGENVYDDALKLKVMAFQKSRGLMPDGVIGIMTMPSLESAGNDPGIPRLDPNLH
jgi:general secretion pathway protein A